MAIIKIIHIHTERTIVLQIDKIADDFGVDVFRYFLLREIPFGQDGDFSRDSLIGRINGDLANGLGTFWAPYMSQNWYTMGSGVFLEHPPLVYAIQGLFFMIFGDGMYTERIYCLFTALISALLIVSIWKLVTRRNENIRKLSWLP